MKKLSALSVLSVALVVISVPAVALAQITAADYQRAQSLRQQYESAAVFVPDTPTWVGTTHRFYYRRSLANGFEFVMVDADTQRKQAAFDHARLADALSSASGRAYSGTRRSTRRDSPGDRRRAWRSRQRWVPPGPDRPCLPWVPRGAGRA